ncbi:zinc finger protein 780B-like [Uranotaenia lowii]|uniref:zinc finger protein 780B-like n=1 Tax=Uranotaenia lowii TaxID=190385 RepID=UPI00247A2D9A|nr:zinc finger protein 780B-like [Uranotaenia lowii]
MDPVNKSCRVCHRTGTVPRSLKMIYNVESGVTLADMIEALAGVKIHVNDGRSKAICNNCMQKVLTGYAIRGMILEAEPVSALDQILVEDPDFDSSDDHQIIMDVKLEQTVLQESSAKEDEYEYEFLETEIDNSEGHGLVNCDSQPDGSASEEESSHVDSRKRLSAGSLETEISFKNPLLERFPQKQRFVMPQPGVILRKIDNLDHFVVEVKGDRCCGCSFVGINRRELLQHSDAQHSFEFEENGNYCPICFFEFDSEDFLNRHIDGCKSKSIYVCKGCEFYFNSVRQIERHLAKCTTERVISTTRNENIHIATSEANDSKLVGNLDQRGHDEDDFEQLEEFDLIDFSSSEEKSNTQTSSHGTFSPAPNGYRLSEFEKSLIEDRVSFQTFEFVKLGAFRCCSEACEFSCDKKDQLFQHSKAVHLKENCASGRWLCPICGSGFANNAQLAQHINIVTNKILLICCVCDEAFVGKNNLKAHQIHSENHKNTVLDLFGDESLLVELNDEKVDSVLTQEMTSFNRDRARPNNKSITRHRHLEMPEPQFITSVQDMTDYQKLSVRGERCCGCGLFFETYNEVLDHGLQVHLMENMESLGDFQCDICYARFEWDRGLLLHRSSRRAISTIFHCTICNLNFSKEHTLDKHLKTAHNHKSNLEVESQFFPYESDEPKETSSNKFHCCFPRCSHNFESETELLNHATAEHYGKRRENEIERTTNQNVCPVCSKSFENTTCLVWHRFTRFTKQYTCRFCAQVFPRWAACREHENVVHLKKDCEYPCQLCTKVFLTPQRLKAHSVIHSVLRTEVCEDCGASFRNKGILKRHRRAVHAVEQPFDCGVCNRKFPTQEQLNAHSRVHTGAKPFPCRYCERAFSHFTDRKRHEMGSHTGERPYQCAHCPAAYIRKRELALHEQKHALQGAVAGNV